MSKKKIANVIEQKFYIGDDAKEDFILVKLVRKGTISHYAAEVMKDFHRYEYEIKYYKNLENISKYIRDRENVRVYLSILSSDI